MGMKTIWDGEDVPPKGCEVLVHLASQKAWVRHVVTGCKVSAGCDEYNHRVEIQLAESDDPRSSNNARLLGDIRPLDDMEAVLEAQAEKMDLLDTRAKRLASQMERIEILIDGDPDKALAGIIEVVSDAG